MRNCASEVWSFGPSRNDVDGFRPALTRRLPLAASGDALFPKHRALDACLDETIQNLNNDTALLLDDGGSGPRRTGGEIFSNVKTGIVIPLVVELKHPGFPPEPCLTTGFGSEPFKPV